ncbi:MAG: AbrB/MazE/SpoVT family DNA-binding domain-containing protein [Candidatus Baldrarchaeia archaeon]
MYEIVSVTKKGQATIPKRLREKYGIQDKVMVIDVGYGILLKPVPTPDQAYGSLKGLFGKKSSKELLREAREEDLEKEKRLLEHVGEK